MPRLTAQTRGVACGAVLVAASALAAACAGANQRAQRAAASPSPGTTATASPVAGAWRQRNGCSVPTEFVPPGTHVTSCVRLRGSSGFAFGTSPAAGNPAGLVAVVVGSQIAVLCPAPPDTGARTQEWGSFECDWARTRDVGAIRRDPGVRFRFPLGGDVWVAAATRTRVVFTVDGGRLLSWAWQAPTGWYFTGFASPGEWAGYQTASWQSADYLPTGKACAFLQRVGPFAGPHPAPRSGEDEATKLFLQWPTSWGFCLGMNGIRTRDCPDR